LSPLRIRSQKLEFLEFLPIVIGVLRTTRKGNELESETKDDRYRIESRIGSGAMATVYKAFDVRLQRIVALKILHEHLSTNTELKLRFEQEAQLAARIDHPNVVRIYDVGINSDQHMFIVSEFVEGRSLTLALRNYSNRAQSFLHPVLAALVGIEIAKGMEAAHRHAVIHRDLKPDNVLVHKDGLIKLTDFGIARPFDSSMTQAGQFIGSLTYSSPEQINSGKVDARSDIFSFGVILFELLTGQLPFRSTNPTDLALKITQANVPPLNQIRPSVPFELDGIVRKCLRALPDERPRSADQIVTELLKYLASQEVMPGARSIADGFENPNLFASTVRRAPVETLRSDSQSAKVQSDAQTLQSDQELTLSEPSVRQNDGEKQTHEGEVQQTPSAEVIALELARPTQTEQRVRPLSNEKKKVRPLPQAQRPNQQYARPNTSHTPWAGWVVFFAFLAAAAGWLIQEREKLQVLWRELQQSRGVESVSNTPPTAVPTAAPTVNETAAATTPLPEAAKPIPTRDARVTPRPTPSAEKSPPRRQAKKEPPKKVQRTPDKEPKVVSPVRTVAAKPTPKPTPAQTSTQLVLRTDPGEMTVYINGVFAGLSSRTGMPRTFEVNAGNIIVRIPSQDNNGKRFREAIRRFKVEAGKTVDLATITLTPFEQMERKEK
jgi:serine/threonine protein kinase